MYYICIYALLYIEYKICFSSTCHLIARSIACENRKCGLIPGYTYPDVSNGFRSYYWYRHPMRALEYLRRLVSRNCEVIRENDVNSERRSHFLGKIGDQFRFN